MNYYISDLHFTMQKAADRMGIHSTWERDRKVIETINSTCKPNDTLYILGDVGCAEEDPSPYVKQILAKKILITGNHDMRWLKHVHFRKLFEEIYPMKLVHDNGTKIFLCHYPLAEWDGFYKGYWHFYGHVHNATQYGAGLLMQMIPRTRNVSIDVIGRPVTAEDLMRDTDVLIQKPEEGLSPSERRQFMEFFGSPAIDKHAVEEREQ